VAGRLGLRRSIASLTIVGVLGLAFLPSEHVHAGDGRHTDVHRHFEPHHPDHAPEPGVAIWDHADGTDAQWLTSLFVTPKAESTLVRIDDVVWEERADPQAPETAQWTPPATYVSVHDPPWAAPPGLRAPPSSLV
jgi:hypothetical protein